MLPDLREAKDHRDAMVRLVNQYGWRRGAELGIGGGHLSRRLMERCRGLERLYAIDTLRRPDRAARVRDIHRAYPGRYILLGMTTLKAARRCGKLTGWLDFIFIDAGHSYQAVRDDIAAWRGTVRTGGVVLGHDYDHPKYPGVAIAVHKAFGERVQVLGHGIWGVEC